MTNGRDRLKVGGYALLALLILLVVALIIGPRLGVSWRAPVFIIAALLLVSSFAAIGRSINGRLVGLFIDNRNRISLSKAQAGAWTIVVLAAFATAAAFNISAEILSFGTVTALAVTIPGELLLAMGISATSLVATPGLLSIKSQEPAADGALSDARAKIGNDVGANGKVLTRTSPIGARWSDLFTGDELGNAGAADLGKIQQAFFTLILLGAYSAYVVAEFSSAAKTIDHLPGLDKSFVWLMGVSHASYLAYKAAPHTQSGSSS